MKQEQPPAHASARLFLALCPTPEVQAALALHRDQWHWNAKPTFYQPTDWHLTLHFIGPVADDRLDELRAGLALPITPFDLRLGQAELWPHGLAVLCAEPVPTGLRQLHADLAQALQRLGLKTDPRPFRPHFTLARHAQVARPPRLPFLLDWHVDSYALMESTGQAAPRYRVLQQYRASAPGGGDLAC